MLTREGVKWMGVVFCAVAIVMGTRAGGAGEHAGASIAQRAGPSSAAMFQMLRDLRAEVDSLLAGVVPPRTIVAWYPTNENVHNGFLRPPEGWLICDGDNGTPDLRDRFIYGTDSFDKVATEDGAGSHSHTTSHVGGAGVEYDNEWGAAYQHSHTVSTASNLPPLVRMIYVMKE